MAKSVVAVAMLAVVAVVSVSCGGSDTVRMGTEGAYPPFNFINDDGEIDGLERELGDELCRRADLECEWVTNEWDSMIPNLLDGKYDTILAGMSITDERDEVIDFTQPYVPPVPSVYMALAEAGDDAVSGRVAAQTATVQADFLTIPARRWSSSRWRRKSSRPSSAARRTRRWSTGLSRERPSRRVGEG